MREWSSSFMHDEYGEPSFLVWIWRIVKIGTSFGTILNSSNILKEIDTTYIDGICWIQCMFYWIWNIRRHTSEKMKPTTITIGLVISRYFYNNLRNKTILTGITIRSGEVITCLWTKIDVEQYSEVLILVEDWIEHT